MNVCDVFMESQIDIPKWYSETKFRLPYYYYGRPYTGDSTITTYIAPFEPKNRVYI